MATRTYAKGGFTVFWDSTRCIHTGICLRSLHSVFNFENRPWVNLDGGDVKQIIATAKSSFVDGANWAYLAGILAVVLGAVLVFFLFPKKQREEELLAEYDEQDTAAPSDS